jgi:hypothetical protein
MGVLINSDLPFLCDSVPLWPILPFQQPASDLLRGLREANALQVGSSLACWAARVLRYSASVLSAV